MCHRSSRPVVQVDASGCRVIHLLTGTGNYDVISGSGGQRSLDCCPSYVFPYGSASHPTDSFLIRLQRGEPELAHRSTDTLKDENY
ncbi:hypothetical protein JZ751_022055 [Albula glossodonta]|uniref:Uncharacterized protein n=1 Tax=Albula glossodonta TaxID=121402 RepID=A0A8T2NIQ4_9TELE|nr:hypothetical protein JZ751_022055 [Albula glossodonta]